MILRALILTYAQTQPFTVKDLPNFMIVVFVCNILTIGHRIAGKKFDTKIIFGQKSNKTIGMGTASFWWPLVTLFENV